MRVPLAVLVGFAATACGSSSMTGYGNNGSNPPPPPVGNSVSIVDYAFSPDTLTVSAGTQVTWVNDGAMGHTATADDNSWNSGTLAAPMGGGGYGGMTSGGSFSHTFDTPGTYAYHCGIHSSMHGVIKVN